MPLWNCIEMLLRKTVTQEIIYSIFIPVREIFLRILLNYGYSSIKLRPHRCFTRPKRAFFCNLGHFRSCQPNIYPLPLDLCNRFLQDQTRPDQKKQDPRRPLMTALPLIAPFALPAALPPPASGSNPGSQPEPNRTKYQTPGCPPAVTVRRTPFDALSKAV